MRWKDFYGKIYEWSPEYARERSEDVCEFGDEDEVMEVVDYLFFTNEEGASQFVQSALRAGVRFHEENLVEISGRCNADTVKQAVFLSGKLLTEKSLEVLYGNIDEEVIVEVAKQQNIDLRYFLYIRRFSCLESE